MMIELLKNWSWGLSMKQLLLTLFALPLTPLARSYHGQVLEALQRVGIAFA